MIDLLIAPCGQLLTLGGDNRGPRRGGVLCDLGIIENGALGITLSSGTIAYAGPLDALPRGRLAPDCQEIDASGRVVLPGFVDSHTHLVFAGDRAEEFYRRAQGESYQDIARSGGGILKTMEATRAASPNELLAQARARLLRMYSCGTTAVEAKSGYGPDSATERMCLEVVAELRRTCPGLVFATYLGAHILPPQWAGKRMEYVQQVAADLGQLAAEGLADFCDVFVDPLAFSRNEAAVIVDAGRKAGLGLKLHADEFGDDGTAAWGVAQGAVSLDHLGGIGEAGIQALAGSSTVATLLPATMFFSGHGKYAPARKMIDAGCAVALATDLNPGSSLVYSMPFVLTLAVLEMGMSAEECIVASTINGAHALGVDGLVGSLEPGKRADFVIAEVPHYRELPYHVGGDLIRDVFIGGNAVKRNYALTLAW
jgi:imidazolonepropionase